jgi:hypothetical protein
MFEKVSLGPSFIGDGPLFANIIIGGSEATPLKKLYGAQLSIPSLLIVVIQAIGLGIIQDLKGLYLKP